MNHQPNQGPFGNMVPIVFPFPNQPPERMPVRVRAAFAALEFFASKTEPIVTNDAAGASTMHDGPSLTDEEKAAQATAADLLNHFLQGLYKPGKEEVKAARRRARRKSEQRQEGPGTIIQCINCGGRKHVVGTTCELCHGAGHLLVLPSSPPMKGPRG